MITKEAAALITIARTSTQMSDTAPEVAIRSYLCEYYCTDDLSSISDDDLIELAQSADADCWEDGYGLLVSDGGDWCIRSEVDNRVDDDYLNYFFTSLSTGLDQYITNCKYGWDMKPSWIDDHSLSM